MLPPTSRRLPRPPPRHPPEAAARRARPRGSFSAAQLRPGRRPLPGPAPRPRSLPRGPPLRSGSQAAAPRGAGTLGELRVAAPGAEPAPRAPERTGAGGRVRLPRRIPGTLLPTFPGARLEPAAGRPARRDAALTNPPGTTRRRTPRPWSAAQAGGRRGSGLRAGDRPPAGDPEKRKRRKREGKKRRRRKKRKRKKKTPLFDWATGHAQCDGRFRVPVPLAAFCERPGLGSGGGGEPPNAAWAGDRTRHRGGPRQAGAPPAVQLGHFLSCAHGSRASQGCLTGRDTDPAVRAAHQG